MEEPPISKKHTKVALTLIILVIVVASVTILYFLLRGNTTVTHTAIDNESSVSFTCTANNFSYPFFDYDESIKKETTVNVIFSDNNKLSSISLTEIMYYPNTAMAEKSSTLNHASMNKSFGSILGADALNANYNVSDSAMRMQIYANSSQYAEESKKYFLANDSEDNMRSLKRNFEKQGFECNIKE